MIKKRDTDRHSNQVREVVCRLKSKTLGRKGMLRLKQNSKEERKKTLCFDAVAALICTNKGRA